MATLSHLADAHVIERIEVDLEPGQLSWRCLYGTPDFIDWLENVLPAMETGYMGADLTPIEQVDDLFHQFISGQPLPEDRRFKPLHWTPDHYIWQLKTIDVRITGWFVEMDKFVCAYGGHKDVLGSNGVSRLMLQTVYVRDHLDLIEPKYLTSKEYANVLSNAD